MGSIYARGRKLWIRFKGPGGWTQAPTEFLVGEEKRARAVLEQLEQRLRAGEVVLGELGPVAVERFYWKWIKDREAEVQTWANDEYVFRLHVNPVMGKMRIDEVRPSDVLALVRGWRKNKGLAPKTVHTMYSSLCAFFRAACLENLREQSPCMLTKKELGPKSPMDPEFMSSAIYTRAELERLISDAAIDWDRRVLYALEGIGGLRHGEAAGLRWRNCLMPGEPLQAIYVAFSYGRAYPKGGRCRPVPVHPVLAAILAEWKLHGWPKMFGRSPGHDDLVLPVPPGNKRVGEMRARQFSGDRLELDLEQLGLRHRRGHDLRRTFISLSRSDGADKDKLKRVTHKPPAEVIEGYTWFEWPVVCAEVLKLRIERRGGREITTIVAAACAERLATPLATSTGEVPPFIAGVGMALPGLEPGRGTSEQHRPASSASSSLQNSGGSGAAAVERVDGPPSRCSNVARPPYSPPRIVWEARIRRLGAPR